VRGDARSAFLDAPDLVPSLPGLPITETLGFPDFLSNPSLDLDLFSLGFRDFWVLCFRNWIYRFAVGHRSALELEDARNSITVVTNSAEFWSALAMVLEFGLPEDVPETSFSQGLWRKLCKGTPPRLVERLLPTSHKRELFTLVARPGTEQKAALMSRVPLDGLIKDEFFDVCMP